MNTTVSVSINEDIKEENIKPKKAIKKYLREVKSLVVAFVTFIFSILLFWADWFLIQYSWINMYDGVFRITETVLIPILILMLLSGVFSLILLSKRLKKKGVNVTLKLICLIVSLIAIVGTCAVFAHSFSSAGSQNTAVTNIESKEIDTASQYYLVIKEVGTDNIIKIKCDNNTYNNVIINENILYTIEYRLNLFDLKSGNLYKIDLDNYIDNRKNQR
jgi:hypothetical protein